MQQKRILIRDLSAHFDQTVMIQWYMHDFRKLGKIAFLIMRDRSWLCQIIVDTPDMINLFDGLYPGSVLEVVWVPILAPGNKQFGMEIQHPIIRIITPCHHVHGIDISKPDLNLDIESMIDNRVVTLRHPKQQAIFKISSIVEKHMRAYFDIHDFTQINSPKLIWFPTEWGAEVFELDYFEKKAYLAQSPQFYKQMMVPVFERVYEIGKAYRAEKSNSSRHLTEILMLDVEMWFISFDELLLFITDFLNTVIWQVRKEWEDILNLLWSIKPLLPESYPRITVKDLHELYFKETWQDCRADWDLNSAEEKRICEYSAQYRWSDAVIVTAFPWSEAKFYHIQDPLDPESTLRADLLFRGVEIATVPMRQTNYDILVQQIKDKWFDPTNPWLIDYLDSFKYGMPPEWWFGFGISRLVQKIIWLSNIKEAELFPRDRNRLTP